jgi:transcriptional regulator with XRE-family HTH domain
MLQRLTKLRKSKKLTQEQLAKILNIDRTSIGKYENSGVIPGKDVLIKLSEFFGVSIDYLLENDSQVNYSQVLNDDEKYIVELYSNANIQAKITAKSALEIGQAGDGKCVHDIALLIGTQVKKFREQQGMSQDELAAAIGSDAGKVSAWESGYYTPGAEMMIRLCEFFDVTMDEMFGREKNQPAVYNDELRKSNIERFESLTEEQQADVLRIMRHFAQDMQEERDHRQ